MHTQAGYIRYWRYDLLGNVHDTGRIYTPFGTDQTDFHLLTKSHRYTDSIIPNPLNKHSFDNILLVYAQDEDVSILATRKQWAAIGRNLIPRAKGVAVCVYRNAKLTLDYSIMKGAD